MAVVHQLLSYKNRTPAEDVLFFYPGEFMKYLQFVLSFLVLTQLVLAYLYVDMSVKKGEVNDD